MMPILRGWSSKIRNPLSKAAIISGAPQPGKLAAGISPADVSILTHRHGFARLRGRFRPTTVLVKTAMEFQDKDV